MVKNISIGLGILISAGLVFVSLWAWQAAPSLASDFERPDTVLLAVRTASVAAGALAQTVLLLLVVGNIYRTRAVDVLLRFLTAAVFAVSLVSAIALGLVGH